MFYNSLLLKKNQNRPLKKDQTRHIITKHIGHKKIVLLILLLFVVTFAFCLKRYGYINPEKTVHYIQSYRLLAPFLFILVFILFTVFLVPFTLPLNLCAGLLWGPIYGSVITIIGATMGAMCSFIISRYLFREYCKHKFQNTTWLWLSDKVDKNGWKIVAFTRMYPIFAAGPLNYFYGISPIRFSTYLWSTTLFFIPPVLLFSYIGHTFGWEVFQEGPADLIQNIIRGAAVVAAIIIGVVLARIWLKRNSNLYKKGKTN
jgi:uncharacterized membrane protein YdjX (TVP38/TMEM64 family)